MKCKYEGCKEDVFEESDLCILHLELPKDEKSEEFRRIIELKNDEVENKKKKGDFNFKGAKLYDANFLSIMTEDNLIFTRTIIKGNAQFNEAKIGGDVWFDRSKIFGDVSFEGAEIDGNASFYGVEIDEHVLFDKTKIGRYAWFEHALIGGEVSFNWSEIRGSVSFQKAEIDGNTSFYGSNIGGDARFDESKIVGDTWFDFTQIKGGLSFKGAHFKNVRSQERACRKAKTIWEGLGDREKADYHFYREMEAKRKQKQYYIKYPELIVQYPFGYGVYPSRLLYTFLITLVSFALIYWILEGVLTTDAFANNMRFSFLTIIIPAYGVIYAKTGILGILAVLEALIGAFTWPTFIVTFARKFMR